MPAPFYNAIKGTTAGTPGTGAFTPNAASSGFRAWSNVPSGWIGLVRYEDGSAWELTWSYWDGSTLTRASTQMFDSSTGSALSLSSSATAAMVVDAAEVMSHLGGTKFMGWLHQPAGATLSIGLSAPSATITGTGAAGALATTNYLTTQDRLQITSATTASAQAGASTTVVCCMHSTTAGRGGFECVARWGPSGLPTGPRLFVGMTSATQVGSSEPSAVTAHYAAFAKDSTDTNIQLLVNSNAGAGTKTDTGIPLTANGWYESAVWMEPGGTRVYGLLIRMDTGAIWFGSTTTDTPGDGAQLFPQLLGGLSPTTGTAFIMNVGSVMLRAGG